MDPCHVKKKTTTVEKPMNSTDESCLGYDTTGQEVACSFCKLYCSFRMTVLRVDEKDQGDLLLVMIVGYLKLQRDIILV